MRERFARRNPRARVRRTYAVLLVLAIAGGAVIGAALATTSTKNAGAQFLPATHAAGATETYTLHLANDASSNQTLGSANVTVPAGFTVVGSSLTNNRNWSATLNGSAIELRAETSKRALAPGQTLVVSFTATAPCTPSPQPIPWQTFVKQSNNFLGSGNDFVVNPQPTVTLAGGGTPTFEFAPVADPQAVGQSFEVTVTAKDGCGNTDASYTGTPTLGGLAAGATYTSLVFTSTSGGVASADVTPASPETDAQLTAVDGARQGTSNSFDVVGFLCTSADVSPVCEATDAAGTTSVSTARPTGSAKLAISFSGGSSTCGSSVIGSSITLDPIGYASGTNVTFTWDKAIAPGTGVANFVLCWSKPDQAPSELPKCGKHPQTTCELKRSRTGVGDLEIVLFLDPSDPEFDLE